ncbi:hypothetical protein [Micromonospora sp. NPDC048839]|uniref:hypothetical protein n=1 Tax=Micromonospora sp. NPDC048839 TaxID=3155641 RepID=UPI0033C9F22C
MARFRDRRGSGGRARHHHYFPEDIMPSDTDPGFTLSLHNITITVSDIDAAVR